MTSTRDTTQRTAGNRAHDAVEDTGAGTIAGRPWWQRSRDAEAYAQAKRRLEWPMLALAVVFTVALVLGELGELDGAARVAVGTVNVAVWLAFVAEYLWLLRLAPDRAQHVRTHLLDLLIIVLPVLRPLRALRVLRLLRLVTVAARSWQSIISVLRHRGLAGTLGIVAALLGLAGLVVYALEPESFPSPGDAIWWVLVTSTTVGYGDYAPVGAAARAIAVAVMVLGVGLVGVITANIVDYLVSHDDESAPEAAANAGEASTAPTDERCAWCTETAERLARIEARLEELASAGGGHSGHPGAAG